MANRKRGHPGTGPSRHTSTLGRSTRESPGKTDSPTETAVKDLEAEGGASTSHSIDSSLIEGAATPSPDDESEIRRDRNEEDAGIE